MVIADFFHDDWLPDQLERQKSWRDYVLKDDYYLDGKNSPLGLLLFYKLNVRLIEALYLFNRGDNNNFSMQSVSEPAPLEECLWRDHPTNLSEAELNNPLLTVSNFFMLTPYSNTGNNWRNGWEMACHQKRPGNSLQHPT